MATRVRHFLAISAVAMSSIGSIAIASPLSAAEPTVELIVVRSTDGVPEISVIRVAESLEAETITALEADPSVQVSVNVYYQPFSVAGGADPRRAEQWWLDRIGEPAAQADNATGSGAKVAVLDTGISDISNLTSQVVLRRDFVGGPAAASGDHGTSVASIIAANRGDGVLTAGVAPNVQLLDARVCNALGCSSLAIMDAVVWSVNNGANVINLSLGGPNPMAGLGTILRWATAQGVVVVAAAGNQGATSSVVNYPAAYDEVIAVGATTTTDVAAAFSSHGSYVDIAAPGQDVLTTSIFGAARFDGTSGAAPVVSGMVALIRAAHPEYSPVQVQAVLQHFADAPANSTGRVVCADNTIVHTPSDYHADPQACTVTHLLDESWLTGAGVVRWPGASAMSALGATTAMVSPGDAQVSVTAPNAGGPYTVISNGTDTGVSVNAGATTTLTGLVNRTQYAIALRSLGGGTSMPVLATPYRTAALAAPVPLPGCTPSISDGTLQNAAWTLPGNAVGLRLFNATSNAQLDESFSLAVFASAGACNGGKYAPFTIWLATGSYYVKAVDVDGNQSGPSSPFAVVGAAATSAPDVTVSGVTASRVTVSWPPIAGVPKYLVYNPSGTWTYTTGNTVTFTAGDSWPDLNGNLTVHSMFTPRAMTFTAVIPVANNGASVGPYAIRNYAPFDPLGAVSDLSVSAVVNGGGQPVLRMSWSAAPNADYYRVYARGELVAEVCGTSALNWCSPSGNYSTFAFDDPVLAGIGSAAQFDTAYDFWVVPAQVFTNGTYANYGVPSGVVTASYPDPEHAPPTTAPTTAPPTAAPPTTPPPTTGGDVAGQRLASMTPERLVDTRDFQQRQAAKATLRVDLPATVPLGVTAVVVNVTAVQPSGDGFVTGWATGPVPDSSLLNYRAGSVTAASAVISVSGRSFNLYTWAATDLVVDISGYVTSDATKSGFTPIAPTRIVDTRDGTGTTAQPVVGERVVSLPEQYRGATAVAVNLGVTNTHGDGFLAAYPGQRPNTSNVNHLDGDTVSNFAIVPVSPDGTFRVYSYAPSDVIIDLLGVFGSDGTYGLVPYAQPERMVDTRSSATAFAARVLRRFTAPLRSSRRPVALLGTVTAVDPQGDGFLAVIPGDSGSYTTSNVNYRQHVTTANLAIIAMDGNRQFSASSWAKSDVIIDVAGAFVPL